MNCIEWRLSLVYVALALGLPAAATKSQTTQPALAPTVLSAELDRVLQRFERAGDGLKDLQCQVKYTVVQRLKENPDDPEESQIYEGHIKLLKATGTTRSLIHFERWTEIGTGKRPTWNKNQQWFLFDGRILEIAKEVTKTVELREIVGPGEQIDPFKIGEGPFPLPFGQKKEDVLQEFEVTLMSPEADDPPATDHIICTPRARSSLAERYEKIELYISHKQQHVSWGLPLKIIAVDRKEQVTKIVEFKRLKKNGGLSPAQIRLPARTQKWERL